MRAKGTEGPADALGDLCSRRCWRCAPSASRGDFDVLRGTGGRPINWTGFYGGGQVGYSSCQRQFRHGDRPLIVLPLPQSPRSNKTSRSRIGPCSASHARARDDLRRIRRLQHRMGRPDSRRRGQLQPRLADRRRLRRLRDSFTDSTNLPAVPSQRLQSDDSAAARIQ